MWIIGGRLDYREEAVFGYNISKQRDLLSRYYSHTLSLLAAEVRKVAILQNPRALFRLRWHTITRSALVFRKTCVSSGEPRYKKLQGGHK